MCPVGGREDTVTDYITGLKQAEKDLDDLAAVIDEPVRDDALAVATLALAHRSRSYYKGFHHALDGPEPISAMPLLRPMVEMNILLRFLARNPVLHVELWHAESDRTVLTIHDEYERDVDMRRRWGEQGPLSPQERETLEEHVRRARTLAVQEGVPGVSAKRGPVLPSVVHQLDLLNDPGAREAYTLAYRSLSSDVHAGAWAFRRGAKIEVLDQGFVRYAEVVAAEDLLAARTLATTTFASTLALVSSMLDLHIEDAVNEVKHRYAPPDAPDPGEDEIIGSQEGSKA